MIPSPMRPVLLKQKERHKLQWNVGAVLSPFNT